MSSASTTFITLPALLAHWQGHRRLTRRVIDAFPDDKLFTFSIGGMRPFGELAMEMVTMAVPMLQGAISDEWNARTDREPRPKQEVLRLWRESTDQLNALWPHIPGVRFQQTLTAFGQWPGALQGYVYLRALGIEPPPFYERR